MFVFQMWTWTAQYPKRHGITTTVVIHHVKPTLLTRTANYLQYHWSTQIRRIRVRKTCRLYKFRNEGSIYSIQTDEFRSFTCTYFRYFYFLNSYQVQKCRSNTIRFSTYILNFQFYRNIKPTSTRTCVSVGQVPVQKWWIPATIHVIPCQTYQIPIRINTKVEAPDTHVTTRLHIRHPSQPRLIRLIGPDPIPATVSRLSRITFIIKIVTQTIMVWTYRLGRLHLHPCRIILT